jgi:hypothetical protein
VDDNAAVLQRLNQETFQAEAKHVPGKDWVEVLSSTLASDFTLRRAKADVQDESRETLIARIEETDNPVDRSVLEDTVRVWCSGQLGIVSCVVTLPGDAGPQAYQNVKVFGQDSEGNWRCSYWQVTARPMPESDNRM